MGALTGAGSRWGAQVPASPPVIDGQGKILGVGSLGVGWFS
jgi:hypothetical protein